MAIANQNNYIDEKFNYTYTENLNLEPGSELHDFIRDRIWSRANEARAFISNRFSSWNEIDKTLTAYIPLNEKERKSKEKDSTRPVSIVFPYTYTALESLLTYMSLAFFQNPLFKFEGVEPDDEIGAMLLELIIQIHSVKNKVPLAIHSIIRDSFSYGIGIGVPGWVKKYGKNPVRNVETISTIMGTDENQSISFEEGLIFEGNNLINIDPYLFLPDPSVSSDRIQDGEFIGWIDRNNYMNMLSEEEAENSGVFNVRYLANKKDKRSSLSLDESERDLKFNPHNLNQGTSYLDFNNPVDNIKMYVNLIPKQWGLSDKEYPEKWFFCLSSDDIITRCEKAEHNHSLYPISVASPDFDGYSPLPVGKMEIISGLQKNLNFMFNSSILDIAQNMNGSLVFDPYLINVNDLKDPEPGKLIKLRRPAWGRGVKNAIEQLNMRSSTQENMVNANYITSWMDRVSGADQSMQGSLRQGGPERISSSEFQGTRSSAVSRLQRTAMIISMQFMQDIGSMFAVHTQQYLSKETYVKITGRNEERLKKLYQKDKIKVTPFDISINYDLCIKDGSIPGGNFSSSWIDLFKTISSSEVLMGQFDISKIFMYIAGQLGATNIEDFKIKDEKMSPVQGQSMPDEQVLRELEKGNIIPVGEE